MAIWQPLEPLATQPMPRNLPRYIHEFIDRHGRIRRYFRFHGKSTPVPYRPGNASFDALYAELLTKNGLTAVRPLKAEKQGFIYFVQGARGRIKIGFSEAPNQRLASLQTGHAERLAFVRIIAGTPRDERALHARFAHLRVSGEWFAPEADLVAFIEQEKAA